MYLTEYSTGVIFLLMACEVEVADEFKKWWDSLSAAEQESIAYSVRILEEEGINLRRPQADTVKNSKYPNMRELRCQHEGPLPSPLCIRPSTHCHAAYRRRQNWK